MRLQRKAVLVTFAVLLVVGTAAGAVLIMSQRQAAIAQFEESAVVVATAASELLRQDMVSNNREHIQEAIVHLGQQDAVNGVVVFSPALKVFASAQEDEVGKLTDDDLALEVLTTGEMATRCEERYGKTEHCVILPIMNAPECHSCHDPSRRVLGAIEIGLDRAPLDSHLADQTLIMASAGGLILLAVGGLLAYTQRVTLLKPLTKMLDDATHEAEAQQAMYLTNRLASVGEMASGVAHELNNPLAGIVALAECLVSEPDLPDDLKEDIAMISDEAQRTARIVRHLLSFARKQVPEVKQTDLNEVLDSALRLREYEQRTNSIEVERRLDPDLPTVDVDPHQMQQVFLNIILNAESSMIEAHQRGRLTIVSEAVDRQVRVTISDDGTGIPDEMLSKIFDPFFTTKGVGKGTGLGLSICYRIVSDHGGTISLHSGRDGGAHFVIELPCSEARVPEAV